MEPKKAVIVKHKKIVVRLKNPIAKPIEPPANKPKRQSRKLLELLAQGKRYYRFVQDIAMMDKWISYFIAEKKPNDRLREIIEADIAQFAKKD